MSFTRTKAFTGAVPFDDKSPDAVISAIVSGDRPSRPTHSGLTDELWKVIQRCWDQEAQKRPNALEISRSLYDSAPERSVCWLTGFSGPATFQCGNA